MWLCVFQFQFSIFHRDLIFSFTLEIKTVTERKKLWILKPRSFFFFTSQILYFFFDLTSLIWISLFFGVLDMEKKNKTCCFKKITVLWKQCVFLVLESAKRRIPYTCSIGYKSGESATHRRMRVLLWVRTWERNSPQCSTRLSLTFLKCLIIFW